MATYYVDATGGSDTNDGLSENTAWKTVEKANASGLADNNIIKFKRGETFPCTTQGISVRTLMTFEDYGDITKARPIIDGQGALTPITANTRTNFIIRNITGINSNARNFNILSPTNGLVENCTASGATSAGFFSGTGTCTFTTCEATGNVLSGFQQSGGTCTYNKCISTGNNTGGGSNGFTVQDGGTATFNYCKSNSNVGAANGWQVTIGTNIVTCIGCEADGNGEDGFQINNTGTLTCWHCKATNNGTPATASAGDGYTAHDTAKINLYYCTAYKNTKSGCTTNGGPQVIMYGCSFYDNYENTTADDYGIGCKNQSGGSFTVLNTITAHHRYEIYIGEEAISSNTALNINRNCYYDSRGGAAFYYGSGMSFTNYKTNSSQDTSSINADPLFVNASTFKHWLTNSSPCIGKAVSLSTTLNKGLGYHSYWPVGVRTIQQPSLWDIGAFPSTEPMKSTWGGVSMGFSRKWK